MFNLIMRWWEWNEREVFLGRSRIFEFTEARLSESFVGGGDIAFERLARLPCLFMPEGTGEEICRVGYINQVSIFGADVRFEFSLDPDVPPLQNQVIYANRRSLSMPDDFEFSRNHWAVKDVDLYRFLFRNAHARRQRPVVFQIDEHERIDPLLLSVMMPFSVGFNAVYQTIQRAAGNVGMMSRRADDIWENPAVMQDVVALIDRSRVVICDCSDRNPNVFYEAGIAHTLGREVILITQSNQDIPFDLRHLRYIEYLNNGEGLAQLALQVQSRLSTILGH